MSPEPVTPLRADDLPANPTARQNERLLGVLAAIGRILSSSLDTEEIYERFAEEVIPLVNGVTAGA